MTDGELKGTTYAVAIPAFLEFSEKTEISDRETAMVDLLDPDLDVLADDEMVVFEDDDTGTQDGVIGGDIALGDDFEIAFDADGKEKNLVLDEDDLLIDTSRFENVPTSITAAQAVSPLQMNIPEDLADISDLARPDAAEGISFTPEVEEKDDLDFDFDDLKLEELDLVGRGQKTDEAIPVTGKDELDDLSLDDIDLSGSLLKPSPQKAPRSVVSDDDLNFDLDLGAFHSGKTETKKKTADDLPDFTLSLD